MSQAERRLEISIQNVLYCFLVILLHSLSEAVTALEPGSWGYLAALIPWRLAAVAVYGFVFLSGVKLFLPGREQGSLGRFYLRRARTVLLPYLLATAVYLALKWVTGDSVTLAKLLRCVLLGDAAVHLYFVIIILQFYLLMPLWKRLVDRVDPWISLSAALFFSRGFRQCLMLALSPQGAISGSILLYQDRFFVSYLLFWLMGCYAGANYERFQALLSKNRRPILACFAIFTLTDQWCTWLGYTKGIYIPLLSLIGDAYLVFAILACYMLAQTLSGTALGQSGLLGRMDRASYLIYLYHMLVLLLVNSAMNHLGLSGYGLRLTVRLTVVLCITVPGCILWQQIAKKVKTARKRRDS